MGTLGYVCLVVFCNYQYDVIVSVPCVRSGSQFIHGYDIGLVSVGER